MPGNIGEMFYYGKKPWHDKGRKLDLPATAQQAIQAGGLDWEVDLVPIQTAERPPSLIDRRMAVVRKDRKPGNKGRVVGVVHPDFVPLQNREGIEVFDALLGKGGAHYHTGGYLGSGEVIWLLAKMDKTIRVTTNDAVETYMLFTNSHDGTIAIDYRFTTVRVVCQNTLALAFQEKLHAPVFRRRHAIDSNQLEIEARDFFRTYLKAANALECQFQAMHGIEFDRDQFRGFNDRLFPIPKPPARMLLDRRLQRQYETRIKGITATRLAVVKVFTDGLGQGLVLPPAEETLWGALNSVTAFVDHAQEIRGDRYAHILFGSGAELKRRAFAQALYLLPKELVKANMLN